MSAVQPLIDIHQHFFSPGQKARERDRTNGHMTPQERLQGWSPERILDLMDAHGIGTAIGSISTPGVWLGHAAEAAAHAREWNDYAASLAAAHPQRFGFFAALPLPATDAALAELDRATNRLNAQGVGLFTNYEGRYLGDAAFAPTMNELNRRASVVYVHPIAPAYDAPIPGVLPQVIEFAFETTRAILSLLVSDTLRRYPDIRWVFSHTGGALSILADRIERLLQRPPYREHFQDGIQSVLERLHFDMAGTESPVTVNALRAIIPTSQILFGTDVPFVSPLKGVETLARLQLGPEELAEVGSGNARRLLVHKG